MNLFAPFNSDGYKLGHADMYAEGTEIVYSNLTPRSDKIYRRTATRYYDGKLVLVGVQGAFLEIVENWDKFFKMDKGIAIAKFKFLCDNYLGQDVVGTDNLAKLHDIGFLPLEVKSLQEGTKVPMGVPVLTVRNTVDHAYWLVNFLETTISNLTWKSSTAATIATEYRAMLKDFAEITGTPPALIDWQIHDFSARGMSGPEDAARTGFGHLAAGNLGTDSLGSILYAQEYYGGGDFVAGSVPATEHAVATSNILRIEKELAVPGTYNFVSDEQMNIWLNMEQAEEDPRLIAEVMFLYELMQKFPKGILSYVTDSFDFWAMLSRGLPYLKDVILRRDGKLVIRPDSGVPEDVICGAHFVHTGVRKAGMGYQVETEMAIEEFVRKNKHMFPCDDSEGEGYELVAVNEFGEYFGAQISVYVYDGDYDCEMSCAWNIENPTPEQKGGVRVLAEIFGDYATEKGYNLLNDKIGMIYGDSITTKRCLTILERLENNGYASGCIVLGVGSFTYQCVTRDTFGFAVKATFTRVKGVDIPIFKEPKTDSKKKSAKGLLFVGSEFELYNDGVNKVMSEISLLDNVSWDAERSEDNLLVTRFLDGNFMNLTTLAAIREIQ
jgi:nicotinamide phosphoribosyltransferase